MSAVYSPLLLRYRPCNCGGGSYERFYHHTIPEHSLDSASGYFAALRRPIPTGCLDFFKRLKRLNRLNRLEIRVFIQKRVAGRGGPVVSSGSCVKGRGMKSGATQIGETC